MTGRTRQAGLTVLTGAVCVAVAGCVAEDPVPATTHAVSAAPVRPGPGPTALPDLSEMDPAVEAQIRDRYVALTSAIEDPDVTHANLSRAYGEMGNVLMAADYAEAPEPFYLNAQALAPEDRRWPYYLGHLYAAQGNFAAAQASFERALALHADDLPTLLSLGQVHVARGRLDLAEPLFIRALALEPDSIWARVELGRSAVARRDFVQAVDYLEEALTRDPDAANVHYPLAMAYRALGELEKAEAHLRLRDAGRIRQPDPLMRVLRESLRSPSSYEREGIQALASEEWDAAVAAFRRGIELAPDNPALLHRLGTALFMKGDERAGVAQFEEALRVDPEHAAAHYSLGIVMEQRGLPAEALHRFSAAVQSQPSYLEARLRRARLLRRVGRPAEALAEYEQVLTRDPRIPEGAFGYAMALVAVGRYQEARERLGDGMDRFPDQPMFAKAFARLLAAAPDARARDGRQALKLVQELLAQERSFDLGEAMAMALAEVGRYDDAASWQREVMSLAAQAGRDDLAQLMSENLR